VIEIAGNSATFWADLPEMDRWIAGAASAGIAVPGRRGKVAANPGAKSLRVSWKGDELTLWLQAVNH
jgi:hypothetical protein